MSNAHSGGGLPGLATIHKWTHSAHGEGGVHLSTPPLLIIFALEIGIFFFIDPIQTVHNFEFLLFFTPIWAPIVLFPSTWQSYLDFVRTEFFSQQRWVLLELRMPRDTSKTPFAMETFISNLHVGSGETNWYKKYVGGSVRPWWSFEIVSLGGHVHFYIWCRDGYRNMTEAYLYAQYPEVEIIETEDYSRLVDPTSHDWEMWGTEFEKARESPIPIKTYIDYEMEKGDKPEETVDPLAQIVEYFGTLGPEEQFWVQFIIRMTKTERYPKKNGKPQTWRDEATDLINKLREKTLNISTYVDPVTGEEKTNAGFPNPTEGQKAAIKAIELNVAKQGFDVGIRTIYMAPKDKYQGINVPIMLQLFKPFNSETNNAFRVKNAFDAIFGDYPWEDRKGTHKHHLQHQLIQFYRQRQYFYPPYQGQWSIMSTEELATVFHVPSSAVTSPNLPRTQSARAAAPANLPT